jgi:hypothetical protein
MIATVRETDREAFLARLTTTAYQVVFRRGFKGSFADLELDLWRSLRAECERLEVVTEDSESWRR